MAPAAPRVAPLPVPSLLSSPGFLPLPNDRGDHHVSPFNPYFSVQRSDVAGPGRVDRRRAACRCSDAGRIQRRSAVSTGPTGAAGGAHALHPTGLDDQRVDPTINGPEGRPVGDGSNILVYLTVPVTNPEGDNVQLVIGGITEDPADAPGPFGVYLPATTHTLRRTTTSGSGPIIETQDWVFATATQSTTGRWDRLLRSRASLPQGLSEAPRSS